MNQTVDASPAPVVSFDDEPLILVDSDDNPIGYMPKAEAHLGEGTLHRAFSIFLFNSQGEVMLQRRAPGKQLWGGFWANSCCSHPRRGETVADAAVRRLREEVDVDATMTWLYKFEYHAQFGEVGAEHELCSVFVAHSDAAIAVNPNEISEWTYMSPETLDAELVDNPDRYSPWLKLEWPRIREQHWDQVLGACRTQAIVASKVGK